MDFDIQSLGEEAQGPGAGGHLAESHLCPPLVKSQDKGATQQ